jgi:hypothetical protein
MAQTPQQAAQAVADVNGYETLTPEALAIQRLGNKTDNSAAPVSNPPDPQVNSGAGESPASPSQIDTGAAPVGNQDPQADTSDLYTTDSLGNTYKTLPDGTTSLVRAVEVAEDLPVDTPGISQQLAPTDPNSVFNSAPTSQDLVSVGVNQALNQPQIANLQFAPNTDWRVTLRLAPGATYLYNDPQAGILQPLKVTNGVVFPYTPSITTAYRANYSPYDLTHSNYRGYFYQNSYTDAVNLTATFTAQSTSDAAYVLAVIHFFRSVTKMFYGKDAQRGSPPPLVFLSGLGDYQFNNHPCVVSQFNYTMPPEVDYVSSGTPYNAGLNLQPLQNLYSTTLNAISPTVTRLATAFLPPGAQNSLPAPLQSLISNPTYVPSKLDVTLTLLPVQSRQQVSQQFSLKNYANGQLLKGGFW